MIAEIASALGAVKTGMETVTAIRAAGAELDQAELKLKLAELTSVLADVKLALVEASEEAKCNSVEVERLRKLVRKVNEETVEYKGYLYATDSNGKPKGTAYCPVCIEDSAKLILLSSNGMRSSEFNCPRCKARIALGPTNHGYADGET